MAIANVSFNLNIDTGNQAMTDDPHFEMVRVLEDIQRTLIDGYDQGMVLDTNGNRIGTWKIDLEED